MNLLYLRNSLKKLCNPFANLHITTVSCNNLCHIFVKYLDPVEKLGEYCSDVLLFKFDQIFGFLLDYLLQEYCC